MALVNPAVALSTASVFAALKVNHAARAGRFDVAPRHAAGLAAIVSARGNDLEAPARKLCPAVDDVLTELGRQPGCLLARMSGSGATCFGLFANAGHAAAAAGQIGAAHPEWWVAAAPLLYDPRGQG